MTDPETSRGAMSEPEDGREPKQRAEDVPDEDYTQAMAGLHRMSAPHTFAEDLENTIRRRSGGRFFGRKALGDRVPFELLAILVIAIGLVIFFLIRSSQTGSLRYEEPPEAPEISPEAKDVVPQPAPVDK